MSKVKKLDYSKNLIKENLTAYFFPYHPVGEKNNFIYADRILKSFSRLVITSNSEKNSPITNHKMF